jgi:hypothetical protein
MLIWITDHDPQYIFLVGLLVLPAAYQLRALAGASYQIIQSLISNMLQEQTLQSPRLAGGARGSCSLQEHHHCQSFG